MTHREIVVDVRRVARMQFREAWNEIDSQWCIREYDEDAENAERFSAWALKWYRYRCSKGIV